ncbi:MAG TPA: hypothetical protein VE777_19230 [Gaiellales bacterium]|nr:hypothetical protein [Gaiellales bacterium]
MRRLLLRIAALWALYELLIDRIDPVELVAGVAVALIVAAVVRTPAGPTPGGGGRVRPGAGAVLRLAGAALRDTGRLALALGRAPAGGRPRGRMTSGAGPRSAAAAAADAWRGSLAAGEIVVSTDTHVGRARRHQLPPRGAER